MTEKRNFLIEVKIEDKNCQVIQLQKSVDLEITWKAGGVLNPGEVRTYVGQDGKKYSCRPSKGEVIRFEKDGKNYDIRVEIDNIKKGWFKDKVTDYSVYPSSPDAPFTIYHDKNGDKKWKRNWYEIGKEDNLTSYSIKPTQWRWKGFMLVGVIFTLLLASGIIWWMKKKKKKKKKTVQPLP